MNNNFYEIPGNWYSETFNMNTNDLASAKVAFERGNLFNNLYVPYKDYKYRGLRANNPKEELMLNIMKDNFMLQELDLYLDVNPGDSKLLKMYDDILNDKKNLIKEYESTYGPLTLSGSNVTGRDWNWYKSPWPWEGIV